MADIENEFPFGYVDKRRNSKGQENSGFAAKAYAASSSETYRPLSVFGLRERLGTFNAGYYTAARLNSMTKNDLVYAARQADDAAGI